jgi:hypothetical protein
MVSTYGPRVRLEDTRAGVQTALTEFGQVGTELLEDAEPGGIRGHVAGVTAICSVRHAWISVSTGLRRSTQLLIGPGC